MSTQHDVPAPTSTSTRPRHRGLAVAPFIGLLLFTVTAVPLLVDPSDGWQLQLLQNGVVYLVGWAGIGAGIAHLLFARSTAASIGWATSPFETEVGWADLAMGVAGVMAGGQPPSYWLGVIVVSAVFRLGAALGHVRQIVADRNLAPNNTAILLIDVGVPAFLVLGYLSWV